MKDATQTTPSLKYFHLSSDSYTRDAADADVAKNSHLQLRASCTLIDIARMQLVRAKAAR
jgi:hypothetical protein